MSRRPATRAGAIVARSAGRIATRTKLDRAQFAKAALGGICAGLELIRRVPQHFKHKGFKNTQAATDIATAAICCVRLGARVTTFHIPPSLMDCKEWHFATDGDVEVGYAMASEIVAHLEMQHLLKPET